MKYSWVCDPGCPRSTKLFDTQAAAERAARTHLCYCVLRKTRQGVAIYSQQRVNNTQVKLVNTVK